MAHVKLSWIGEWLGSGLIDHVDGQRREAGEVKRNRVLGTLEMVWLFLALAADSGANSLRTVIEQACEDVGSGFKVSVPAFCRQRKRFSPPVPAPRVGTGRSGGTGHGGRRAPDLAGVHSRRD
jgi:hypothetical protein